MNASSTHRSASTLKALTAGLLVAILLGVGAQAASAYTVVGSSGSPGTVSTPYADASYASYASGTIATNARTAYESPGYRNYDQYVCITARLWKLNNYGAGSQAWAKANETRRCAWIRAAASSVGIGGTNFTGLVPYFGYGVDFAVTWQLSNGTVIGRRTYDYTATGDYRCLTGKCYKDNSTIGAFVMFDF